MVKRGVGVGEGEGEGEGNLKSLHKYKYQSWPKGFSKGLQKAQKVNF